MLAGAELPLLRRGARLTNGQPSGGVSDAQVAGRDVELIRGCTEESEHTILVEEARRLVEVEDVDAVVGAIGESDALVFRELARKYPDVVFIPVWSGAQGLTLRHPAANVYRFDTDEAQDVAGLGSYAYRELGMAPRRDRRRYDARRVARGSSLRRGVLRPRREGDSAVHGADRPRRPEGRRRSSGRRRRRRADVRRALRARRLSARARPGCSARPRPGSSPAHMCSRTPTPSCPSRPPAGVVGASSIPPANATPAMRGSADVSSRGHFPGCRARMRRHRLVLAFNDAMEGLLRGLEASDGDLSDGRQRLREELARVRFDASVGPCAPRPEPPGSPQHLPEASRSRGRPASVPARKGRARGRADIRGSPLRCSLPRPRQPAVPKGDSASLGALAARPNRPGEAGLARARAQASGTEPSPDDQRRVVRRSGERGASVPDPVASPAVGEPDDDECRVLRGRHEPSAVGSTRSGSACTPSALWTARDALARRRLASPPSVPEEAPASTSGNSAPSANQAPSSTADQSCSAPVKGTTTASPPGAPSTSTETSHGASSRSVSSRPSSSSWSGASTSTSSASCSAASRDRSLPGVTDVNAAARTSTLRAVNSSRRVRR